MDANSEEEEIQSLLKLKTVELENKLLLEKQRYILLQSELESSKLFASKHLDIYKKECTSLKEKMSILENDNSLLKEKELENQETIQILLKKIERVDKEYGSETQKNCQNLKKTERVDKEYGSETQKNCQNLKKNDNEVKEEDSHDNAVENEGENTQVFVDLGSDSDDGMKYSPTLESKVNSECKTPSKKFKSSSDSILCDDGTLGKKFCMDNHLPRHDTEMKLECEDGAIYEDYYTSRNYALSSRGWVNFSRRIRLEFGDVLVFELTGSTRFKVHIVKAIQEV